MSKSKKIPKHPLRRVIGRAKRGSDYFFGLSHPSALSAQGYAAVRAAAGQTPTAIAKEWREWMTLLKVCDVRPWSLAAHNTPRATMRMFKEWIAQGPGSSSTNNHLTSTPTSPSLEQDEQAISPIASSISAPSSSSSSLSSSLSSSTGSLSQGAVNRMRREYSATFNEYDGSPWLLPSGTDVDRVIYEYTMTLEMESALHSFVIDRSVVLLDCFNDDDRKAFQQRIEKNDTQALTVGLPSWQQQELLRYAQEPRELEVLIGKGWMHSVVASAEEDQSEERIAFKKRLYLAMLRLSSLYEEYKISLPESNSESWYTTRVWGIFLDLVACGSSWLEYKPGEVSSSASSLRRNIDRDLDTRHAQGRKIDGLVFCKKTQCEVGAVEVGKADGSTTGTKVLKDGRKMAKLLKDMADTICSRSIRQAQAKREIRVYGLLISGLRVQFVSLRYLGGRFCQLQRERSLALPLTWDAQSIRSILILVKEMLLLRSRLEGMAQLACNFSHPGPEDFVREVSGESRACTPPAAHIPTLTTPKNSPKRSRESKAKQPPQ
ncbi:hypothetical protein EC968_004869 [Mortierella alpina]|nr:hypothetical protein EC968_004869 [Mortierella alpina]